MLRTEDFQRLLDVTRALAHSLDLRALLAQIVDAARDLLDAERGSVFLHGGDGEVLGPLLRTPCVPAPHLVAEGARIAWLRARS